MPYLVFSKSKKALKQMLLSPTENTAPQTPRQ